MEKLKTNNILQKNILIAN